MNIYENTLKYPFTPPDNSTWDDQPAPYGWLTDQQIAWDLLEEETDALVAIFVVDHETHQIFHVEPGTENLVEITIFEDRADETLVDLSDEEYELLEHLYLSYQQASKRDDEDQGGEEPDRQRKRFNWQLALLLISLVGFLIGSLWYTNMIQIPILDRFFVKQVSGTSLSQEDLDALAYDYISNRDCVYVEWQEIVNRSGPGYDVIVTNYEPGLINNGNASYSSDFGGDLQQWDGQETNQCYQIANLPENPLAASHDWTDSDLLGIWNIQHGSVICILDTTCEGHLNGTGILVSMITEPVGMDP